MSGLRKIESDLEGEEQLPHRPRLVAHYIQDFYLEPSFVIDVTDYVDRKIEVIKAFRTQFYDPNSPEPTTPISGDEFFDFIKGRMLNMGRPAGIKYAEGFTVSRVFGVRDLFELI